MIIGGSVFNMDIQDLLFLILGIGIMVFAIVFSRRLGQSPVELNIEKLGLNLKADRLTLALLLGFTIAVIGVFFRYRGYESKVKDLQGELSKVNSTVGMLNNQLERFKAYDLGINLIFPDDVDPRELAIQVLTKKPDKFVYQIIDSKAETDLGGTWVQLNNLSSGEKIRIKATGNDGTIWECNDIEIPKAQIQMVRKVRKTSGAQ